MPPFLVSKNDDLPIYFLGSSRIGTEIPFLITFLVLADGN